MLVERLWTELEGERTKVGESYPLTVWSRLMIFPQCKALAKENEELVQWMSRVEEMVANLIVDQQAMAKSFQECGDQHSGSLGHHWMELEAARREIDRLQANQATIVDECSVLRTQVGGMGGNLCGYWHWK